MRVPITMGGFDYHTGERATGEERDLRAGQCIGACLEYAARRGKPLMIYVFSDGSLSSNGMVDNSVGRARQRRLDWRQSADRRVVLPGVQPSGSTDTDRRAMRRSRRSISSSATSARVGDIETGSSNPAANAVNLLVETVILNYMALHGEQAQFANLFPTHGLGNSTLQDSLTAFEPSLRERPAVHDTADVVWSGSQPSQRRS